MGMSSASVRFVALSNLEPGKSKLHSYIETSVIANVAIYVTLGIISYFIIEMNISHIVEEGRLGEVKSLIPLMIFGFVILNISGVILGCLQGLHLGYLNSSINVLGYLVQIVVVLILVPKNGLLGMAWAQLAQYTFTMTVSWIFIRSKSGIRGVVPINFSMPAFREMIAYSSKVQAAGLANGLFEPLTKILMQKFGNLEILGVFELAYKTVSLTRNLVASGVSASLPALTSLISSARSQAIDLYETSKRRTILASIIVFVAICLASPIISYLWIGKLEHKYIVFVLVLSIGFLINVYAAPAYLLGMALGVMRHNVLGATLSTLTLIVMGAALGQLLGGLGVVITVSVCSVISAILIKRGNEKIFYQSSE